MSGDHHSFSKRSSSSMSSSSSTSTSASWTSEPSLDDETYLMHKPQHSLSCSNISEVRRKSHDRESEDFDFDHRDQRHRHSLENEAELLPGSHQMPKLSRGHSKSEEGLQQNKDNDGYSAGSHAMDHGPLYKTTSLGQNLAFGGNNDNSLGGRAVPKKAVSSIQLPSKGILKNKDEGQKEGNFRKAKSMEVLSTRVHITGTSKQISMEAARDSFVKGKLQFSAFLDEITRQVISPCALSSLGVTTPTPPKSPNEERKSCSTKQESFVPSPKQQPVRVERPDSGKTDSSSLSRSHKRPGKYHSRNLTSPPPSPRHPSKTERQGAASGKQHHRQYSLMLTDGTSTSPETVHTNLSKHKGRHQSSHGPSRNFHGKQEKRSPPPLRAAGLESESQSSKSSTSASSEKSDRPKHMGHRRQSKPHRYTVRAESGMLEEYNKELHENLLQTVACIENMEAELQCTKTELVSFKEKYRRLQESYSVSQQANSVLEQKLKSAADSLDSERKFLMQRVADLTKQLDTAQKTISSLENINVPSLIKDLLKNHFDSQQELEHFLYPRTSPRQPDGDQPERAQELRNSQPFGGKVEVFEWPQTGHTCSAARQQPATAFLPWKHDHDPWAGLGQLVPKGSDSQLPFSFIDDVSILKTNAPSPQAHQLAMNTEIHLIPPNPYNLDEMRLSRQTGGEGTITVGKEPTDVNYLTAQRMLNEFLNQIPPPTHEGEGRDTLEAELTEKKL
ncbi:clock-controlled 8-like protein [Labeo rohita]|uniref:Clock-controlled 8-like protein n=1 Tax=Labeo rohita TaxID=84645 RepID=A0A498NCN6_LABRO|nr:clock-controlled 8-like protein [Labeo rohita]